MSSDFLIPFGLHKESGELVDVGSVKKGKDCGCICPSCQTPLIARQGKEKEWHFAHKSTKNEEKTTEPCAYSFVVSLRLMVKQLSQVGLELSLPEMNSTHTVQDIASGRSFEVSYPVTKESKVQLNAVEIEQRINNCIVDIVSELGEFTLIIYVTYKGRKIPDLLTQSVSRNLALLELEAFHLAKAFKQVIAGKYTEALRDFLSESNSGIKWVRHPRQEKALAILKSHIAENWDAYINRYLPANKYGFSNTIQPFSDQNFKPQKYNCIICSSSWTSTSSYCENCKTHLYVRTEV